LFFKLQYNSKVKLGRGFSLAELKEAGIAPAYAQTIGIAVDHRRINKSNNSLTLNVERLKAYKARLVVFPKKANKPKKGDATAAEIADARQLTGSILPKATQGEAVTFTTLTEEMKSFEGYAALRAARTDVRLVGNRLKKSKEEKKKEDAPAGDA
jgi:large subunit ribosomal protein L13e